MKLAVIGSRGFSDRARLYSVLAAVKTPISCIVSGGAKGADSMAEEWALAHNVETRIFYPDYKAYEKRAPLVRNELIIREADAVLAFWDGESRGTAHALDYARRAGRPTKIIRYEPEPTPPVPIELRPCRVVIENPEDAPPGLPEWYGITELIERLPYSDRQAGADAGRLYVELEGTFNPAALFDVSSWDPNTGELRLRLQLVLMGISCYEFWYMQYDNYETTRKLKA